MLDSLQADLAVMLRTFRVKHKNLDLLRTMAAIFEISEFGILVVAVNVSEFGQVATALNNRFEDYRIVYVTPDDSLIDKKEELFYELMRSGYMAYVRTKFPRQFNELLRQQNLDRRIVNKRLEIWGEKAKYKWYVEENKAALREATSYILSIDPGFYDFMPEI